MSEDKRPICPYCGKRARLADSKEIYGRSYGPAWLCTDYPACDAYVGCHPNTTKPLGRLANKELRKAKKAAHAAFDRLWGGRRGEYLGSATMHRGEAYRRLALAMGLSQEQCHIGEFDEAQCRRVIEVCASGLEE